MPSFRQRMTDRAAAVPPERRRASELIAAVDAGGIPLSPALVNDIARKLGLQVSVHDPMDRTIARIRQCLR